MSSDQLPARGGQLVRRHLADGDRTTLDELYEAYASRLLSRLMGKWRLPSHAAQDALQDTFVQSAQAMHKIEDTDKVGAWLTKIADRQAMAVYRSGAAAGPRETPSGSPADLESKAGSSAAADDHATAVVDEMVLRAAINELPPKLGSVVSFYYFEGLTLAEIGHVLGCGAPAAHRLLSVARERLTNHLSVFQPVREAAPAPVELPAQYRQAMRRLSHRRREVLERYVYQRMKPVEIAADLNITPGCARVHLHLAYKELATLLGITNYKIVVELLKPLRQPR